MITVEQHYLLEEPQLNLPAMDTSVAKASGSLADVDRGARSKTTYKVTQTSCMPDKSPQVCSAAVQSIVRQTSAVMLD